MKVLLITETVPFPSRNGRELPTAEICLRLARKATVDILITSNDEVDFQKRKDNIPHEFGFCKRIGYTQKGKRTKRIANELRGIQPSYFSKRFDINEVKDAIGDNKYDFLWVSPAELYTFVQDMRENKFLFFERVAIGMNDLKSGMYYDAINEAIGFRTFHFPYLLRYIRSFFMKEAERKFLSGVDVVHVQTDSEANKVHRLFKNSKKRKPLVAVAPNGYKKELIDCEYKGHESTNILYMTQLNKGRKIESRWFVKNIWPKIHREIPEAKLLIPGKIVDINDPSIQFLKDAPNVELLGFVEDLEGLLESVRMGVVPIFHGTGLINRILDNLTASIPTISTTSAINTFTDLKVGEDILSADSANLFAKQTIEVYNNATKRAELSQKGRAYVLENHPNWDDTGNNVFSKMESLLEH